MRLIAFSYILLPALLSNMALAARDDNGLLFGITVDGLDRAHEHTKDVVRSCFQYGLQSALAVMAPLPVDARVEMREAFLEYSNTQTKICLEVFSFKLLEAASVVK
ncbi:exported protein of unknown function [Shewanella benthica]|uniref:Uncharacterized protein n=1 Tax=Shewanella benthica TaxID=43661 RepID=A0A330LWB4_9GAMM|nr:hypothetical protein [Shewanella benthica]SQH74599.1 exported protein of unknown function [Shewanella benthica]